MATYGTLDPSLYSTVWTDNFADNSGLDRSLFPVTWGNAGDLVSGGGMLTITSRASEGWVNSGFIQTPSGATAGQGYGLYTVTAQLDAGQGIGACFGLWPADNVWPGGEIDMLETFASRSSGYATVHWKGADGQDHYGSFTLAVDLTQKHQYALDWEDGRLTYYIDGQMAFTTTDNVPKDAAHGGINEVFAAQVTNAGSAPISSSVSLHLYDIGYSTLKPYVAPPAPPPAPTPASIALGSGPDTLVLKISEDAYNGDAQYTVKVDGVQVGGTLTATAWNSSGLDDTVTVKGSWGGGQHTVTVTFLNDAYGGTPATDRNLYVEGVNYNGNAAPGGALLNAGPLNIAITGPQSGPQNTTLGSGSSTLVLKISEDAWQGDALYTLAVDGVQVGGTLTAHAAHGSGASDIVTVLGNWGSGQHQVAVTFLNDAWGGAAGLDRNLYVDGLTYNGKATAGAALMGTGTKAFTVSGGAPAPASLTLGSGSDTLVLKISEDAYAGDAQYTVAVDGVQVGGTLTATAWKSSGLDDTLTLKGSWGAGQHQVAVTFLNDAYGGSADTDRNLYVDGLTYNGAATAGAALLSSGTKSFTVTGAAPAAANLTVGSGTDSLVLKVSQDAYQGNAQYSVTVDGVQVGGTLTASALHGTASDTVTVKGSWGGGNHVVAVNFLNDAWGGGAGQDRNLYVDAMSYNGAAAKASAALLSNGPAYFLAGDPFGLPGGGTGKVVMGTSGVDQLVGTSGNDNIIGGKGNDGLTGGAGADNFTFSQGDGPDWLNDFTSGTDHLVFVNIAASTVRMVQATHYGTSGMDVFYGTAGDSVFLANVWKLGGADILYA